MSPERQRVVIALEMGIKAIECGGTGYWGLEDEDGHALGGYYKTLEAAFLNESPDYLSDLNAMHKAKRKLLTTSDLCNKFNSTLIECRSFRSDFETDKWTWGQSAEVQAETLIRTIGKWEDA